MIEKVPGLKTIAHHTRTGRAEHELGGRDGGRARGAVTERGGRDDPGADLLGRLPSTLAFPDGEMILYI